MPFNTVGFTNPFQTGPAGPQGATGPAGGFGISGSFYDLLTQTVTQEQESTGVPILLRHTDIAVGWSIINNTEITPSVTGIYRVNYSIQLHNTGGGGNGTTVETWLVKNGQNVPNTNTRTAVIANSPYVLLSRNFIKQINSGDNIKLYWATDNHHIVIQANTGSMGGPEIPSVIVNINQVG